MALENYGWSYIEYHHGQASCYPAPMALMRRVSIAASEYPSINPPWRQERIADGDNGFGICLVVHLHEDRNSQNANNPPSAVHSDSIDRVVDPESKGHTKTTTSVTISANHYTTTSVTASHLRATISPDTRR